MGAITWISSAQNQGSSGCLGTPSGLRGDEAKARREGRAQIRSQGWPLGRAGTGSTLGAQQQNNSHAPPWGTERSLCIPGSVGLAGGDRDRDRDILLLWLQGLSTCSVGHSREFRGCLVAPSSCSKPSLVIQEDFSSCNGPFLLFPDQEQAWSEAGDPGMCLLPCGMWRH